MLSLELAVLTLAAITAPVFAEHQYRNVHTHATWPLLDPRDYITADARLDSYDYIIAGGGLAGLVLASRLSEDGKTTVLVLEAGDTGDAEVSKINSPGLTYFTSLLGTSYDYGYKTVAQASAGGRIMGCPRGKILGGSAAVNGMYMVRPNSFEVDAWHDLIADSSNKAMADSWSWNSLLEAMKKGETFTPPTADAQATAGMKYDAKSHGSTGPLHTTFPAYMVPISSAWLPTLQAAGVPVSEDAYGGTNLGAFFTTSAINPSNWTRSYSKSAYIDSLPPRSNLHVLANAAVTRILFSDKQDGGNQVASGVEFAKDASDTKKTVNAKKEVILAGGAIGSPQILQLSGVGPKDVLDSVNIPVKVELPGVGQHMQDHLASGLLWNTTEDTQGTIYGSGSDFSKSKEFLSFINSGTSYVNGTYLFDGKDAFDNFVSEVKSTFNSPSALTPLIPSSDPTVIEGYKAIYQTNVEKLYPEVGLVEMLFSINSAAGIAVQAALQIPLSQGRVYVNSTSIFDPPVLDPGYFSHPADVVVLRQGLKHARHLSTISPLKELLGEEVRPGPSVQTDAEWEDFIKNNANTEFHPGCTCAMLPKEKGGVVDASLKVYGTTNVRVVDGSIFPLSMSAHLMAPIYGLAEKAAEIIINPPSSTSTGTATGTSTKTGSSASGTGKSSSSAASGLKVAGAMWLAPMGLAVGILMSML